MTLRIGMLAPGFPPDRGGVETHVADLARALSERGHQVHVLCLDRASNRAEYETTDECRGKVSVRRLACSYADRRALADLARCERAERAVTEWVEATNLDIVHVHHLTGFGAGALRAMGGVPIVLTLHDYWLSCPRGQMVRTDGAICASPEPATCGDCLAHTWPHLMPSGSGERRTPTGQEVESDAEAADARTQFALRELGAAARILIPSARAREVFVRAGVPAERLEVCPNGIDVEGLGRAVRAARISQQPRDGLRLGILGAVQPSKGALELAQAFREADVRDLHLEIHGELAPYHGDTSYAEALERLAAGHPRVTLHGGYERDDLPRILAGLDGAAFPARWVEVFGLAAREARAAGLPVLVSDVGGLAEAAEGGAGLVVAPEDRAAWIAAIRRFGTDPEARRRWRGAATTVPDLREMTRRIEAVYADVAQTGT